MPSSARQKKRLRVLDHAHDAGQRGVGSVFFFLVIRRPPRSTRVRSSAASDVYKRQSYPAHNTRTARMGPPLGNMLAPNFPVRWWDVLICLKAVSYTHLRAHETPEHLVCRLLLEKKKTDIHIKKKNKNIK